MRFLRSKYLQQLLAGRGNGMVKIITGVRRCGKSCQMETVSRELRKSGAGKSVISGPEAGP